MFTLFDHLYIPLNIQSGRTGQTTWRLIGLLNGKGSGNGLRVKLIGSLSVRQTFVILTAQLNRTGLGAIAATGAFFHIYITRLLQDSGAEVSLASLKTKELCVCQKFNVQMPADLDQFGRYDSHCTVIGGECLV
jgi:hypothetical protein